MDTLFGLPAHPLLVHIPIVLLPLAALGVCVLVVHPAWQPTIRWLVLGLAVVGAFGAVLAASAGEQLGLRIVTVEGRAAGRTWQHHAQLGDTARNFSLVFLVSLAAFVVVPLWLERRSSTQTAKPHTNQVRWIRWGLAALAVITAFASVLTIVQAGHTGSSVVWEKYMTDTHRG